MKKREIWFLDMEEVPCSNQGASTTLFLNHYNELTAVSAVRFSPIQKHHLALNKYRFSVQSWDKSGTSNDSRQLPIFFKLSHFGSAAKLVPSSAKSSKKQRTIFRAGEPFVFLGRKHGTSQSTSHQ